MSDQNSSWPFGGDTSGEGLDYNAIFGGGSAAGDVNPFDIPAAQAAPAAEAPQPPTAEPAAQPQNTADTEKSQAAAFSSESQAVEPAASAKAETAPAPAAVAPPPAKKQETSPPLPLRRAQISSRRPLPSRKKLSLSRLPNPSLRKRRSSPMAAPRRTSPTPLRLSRSFASPSRRTSRSCPRASGYPGAWSTAK